MNGNDPLLNAEQAYDLIASNYGIPTTVWKSLLGQESGGGKNLVSKDGARGAWQVMPETFRGLGYDPAKDYNDPLKVAEAGLRYLRDNYKALRPYFQDDVDAWKSTIASYHTGLPNTLKNLKTGGNGIPDNSDGLIRTPNYVKAIFGRVDWNAMDRNPLGGSTPGLAPTSAPVPTTVTRVRETAPGGYQFPTPQAPETENPLTTAPSGVAPQGGLAVPPPVTPQVPRPVVRPQAPMPQPPALGQPWTTANLAPLPQYEPVAEDAVVPERQKPIDAYVPLQAEAYQETVEGTPLPTPQDMGIGTAPQTDIFQLENGNKYRPSPDQSGMTEGFTRIVSADGKDKKTYVRDAEGGMVREEIWKAEQDAPAYFVNEDAKIVGQQRGKAPITVAPKNVPMDKKAATAYANSIGGEVADRLNRRIALAPGDTFKVPEYMVLVSELNKRKIPLPFFDSEAENLIKNYWEQGIRQNKFKKDSRGWISIGDKEIEEILTLTRDRRRRDVGTIAERMTSGAVTDYDRQRFGSGGAFANDPRVRALEQIGKEVTAGAVKPSPRDEALPFGRGLNQLTDEEKSFTKMAGTLNSPAAVAAIRTPTEKQAFNNQVNKELEALKKDYPSTYKALTGIIGDKFDVDSYKKLSVSQQEDVVGLFNRERYARFSRRATQGKIYEGLRKQTRQLNEEFEDRSAFDTRGLTKSETEAYKTAGRRTTTFFSPVAGIVGYGARSIDFINGLLRPLAEANVPVVKETYGLLRRQSEKGRAFFEGNTENGIVATVIGTGVGLSGDIARFLLLARIPGMQGSGVVAQSANLALDLGLQSSGRGDNLKAVGLQFIKGGGLGALMPAAGKVSGAVERYLFQKVSPSFVSGGKANQIIDDLIGLSTTAEATAIKTGLVTKAAAPGTLRLGGYTVSAAEAKALNEAAIKAAQKEFKKKLSPEDIALLASGKIKDPAMRRFFIASKIAGGLTEVGVIGGGTYAVARGTGSDKDASITEAITMLGFHFGLKGAGWAAGKYFKKDGKVYTVDPKGKVYLTEGVPDRYVDYTLGPAPTPKQLGPASPADELLATLGLKVGDRVRGNYDGFDADGVVALNKKGDVVIKTNTKDPNIPNTIRLTKENPSKFEKYEPPSDDGGGSSGGGGGGFVVGPDGQAIPASEASGKGSGFVVGPDGQAIPANKAPKGRQGTRFVVGPDGKVVEVYTSNLATGKTVYRLKNGRIQTGTVKGTVKEPFVLWTEGGVQKRTAYNRDVWSDSVPGMPKTIKPVGGKGLVENPADRLIAEINGLVRSGRAENLPRIAELTAKLDIIEAALKVIPDGKVLKGIHREPLSVLRKWQASGFDADGLTQLQESAASTTIAREVRKRGLEMPVGDTPLSVLQKWRASGYTSPIIEPYLPSSAAKRQAISAAARKAGETMPDNSQFIPLKTLEAWQKTGFNPAKKPAKVLLNADGTPKTVRERVAELNKQREEPAATVKALTQENNEIDFAITPLKDRATNLEKQLGKAPEAGKKSIQRELDEVKKSISELTARKASNTSPLSSARTRLSAINREIGRITGQKPSLGDELLNVRDDIKVVQKKIKDVDKAIKKRGEKGATPEQITRKNRLEKEATRLTNEEKRIERRIVEEKPPSAKELLAKATRKPSPETDRILMEYYKQQMRDLAESGRLNVRDPKAFDKGIRALLERHQTTSKTPFAEALKVEKALQAYGKQLRGEYQKPQLSAADKALIASKQQELKALAGELKDTAAKRNELKAFIKKNEKVLAKENPTAAERKLADKVRDAKAQLKVLDLKETGLRKKVTAAEEAIKRAGSVKETGAEASQRIRQESPEVQRQRAAEKQAEATYKKAVAAWERAIEKPNVIQKQIDTLRQELADLKAARGKVRSKKGQAEIDAQIKAKQKEIYQAERDKAQAVLAAAEARKNPPVKRMQRVLTPEEAAQVLEQRRAERQAILNKPGQMERQVNKVRREIDELKAARARKRTDASRAAVDEQIKAKTRDLRSLQDAKRKATKAADEVRDTPIKTDDLAPQVPTPTAQKKALSDAIDGLTLKVIAKQKQIAKLKGEVKAASDARAAARDAELSATTPKARQAAKQEVARTETALRAAEAKLVRAEKAKTKLEKEITKTEKQLKAIRKAEQASKVTPLTPTGTKLEVKLPKTPTPKTEIDPQVIKAVKEDAAAGLKISRLAKDYGLTAQQVKDIIGGKIKAKKATTKPATKTKAKTEAETAPTETKPSTKTATKPKEKATTKEETPATVTDDVADDIADDVADDITAQLDDDIAPEVGGKRPEITQSLINDVESGIGNGLHPDEIATALNLTRQEVDDILSGKLTAKDAKGATAAADDATTTTTTETPAATVAEPNLRPQRTYKELSASEKLAFDKLKKDQTDASAKLKELNRAMKEEESSITKMERQLAKANPKAYTKEQQALANKLEKAKGKLETLNKQAINAEGKYNLLQQKMDDALDTRQGGTGDAGMASKVIKDFLNEPLNEASKKELTARFNPSAQSVEDITNAIARTVGKEKMSQMTKADFERVIKDNPNLSRETRAKLGEAAQGQSAFEKVRKAFQNDPELQTLLKGLSGKVTDWFDRNTGFAGTKFAGEIKRIGKKYVSPITNKPLSDNQIEKAVNDLLGAGVRRSFDTGRPELVSRPVGPGSATGKVKGGKAQAVVGKPQGIIGRTIQRIKEAIFGKAPGSPLAKEVDGYSAALRSTAKATDDALASKGTFVAERGTITTDAKTQGLLNRLFGNQEGTAGFVAPAKAVDDVVDRLMTMSQEAAGKGNTKLAGKYEALARALDDQSRQGEGLLKVNFKSEQHPTISALVKEEENLHWADFKSRQAMTSDASTFTVSEININTMRETPAFAKAEAAVRKQYGDISDEQAFAEVVAKAFRSDAEGTLGISTAERAQIVQRYARMLNDLGITPEQVRNNFRNTSRRGEEFAQAYEAGYGSPRGAVKDGGGRPSVVGGGDGVGAVGGRQGAAKVNPNRLEGGRLTGEVRKDARPQATQGEKAVTAPKDGIGVTAVERNGQVVLRTANNPEMVLSPSEAKILTSVKGDERQAVADIFYTAEVSKAQAVVGGKPIPPKFNSPEYYQQRFDLLKNAGLIAYDTVATSRSLITSVDVSTVGRQNWMLYLGGRRYMLELTPKGQAMLQKYGTLLDPRTGKPFEGVTTRAYKGFATKSLINMFKSFNRKQYGKLRQSIQNDPLYDLAQAAGLDMGMMQKVRKGDIVHDSFRIGKVVELKPKSGKGPNIMAVELKDPKTGAVKRVKLTDKWDQMIDMTTGSSTYERYPGRFTSEAPIFQTAPKYFRDMLAKGDYEGILRMSPRYARRIATWHVRASSRSFDGAVVSARFQYFKNLVDESKIRAALEGKTLDIKSLEGMADTINTWTGYVKRPFGAKDQTLNILNTLLFSPRLAASRIKLLMTPALFAKLPEYARAEAIKGYGKQMGLMALILGGAAAAGAEVVFDDPTDPGAFRIRAKGYSVDITAGQVQWLAYGSRMAYAVAKKVAPDYVKKETGRRRKSEDVLSEMTAITGRQLRKKMAPVPGSVVNYLTGANVLGEPTTGMNEIVNLITPITARNVVENFEMDGAYSLAPALTDITGFSTTRLKTSKEYARQIAEVRADKSMSKEDRAWQIKKLTSMQTYARREENKRRKKAAKGKGAFSIFDTEGAERKTTPTAESQE
jgi:chromosome segregation ATPase